MILKSIISSAFDTRADLQSQSEAVKAVLGKPSDTFVIPVILANYMYCSLAFLSEDATTSPREIADNDGIFTYDRDSNTLKNNIAEPGDITFSIRQTIEDTVNIDINKTIDTINKSFAKFSNSSTPLIKLGKAA